MQASFFISRLWGGTYTQEPVPVTTAQVPVPMTNADITVD